MTVKISFRTEFQDIPKDIKMLVEDVRNSLQAISGSKLSMSQMLLGSPKTQARSQRSSQCLRR